MRLSAALAATFAALLVVGCFGCKGGTFNKAGSTMEPGVFRYPIVTNPTTLDPGIVQDGDTIDLLQQMYEGLVTWSEDNQPVGNLAESWDVEDGGRSYVFHLKKGVKFHPPRFTVEKQGEAKFAVMDLTGKVVATKPTAAEADAEVAKRSVSREVTAEDFKWSFERVTNPRFNSSTAKTYLNDIVGVIEKLDGKAKEVRGVQVVDPYTLRITIDKPRPYFLGKLTYIVSFVVDKNQVPADREINSVAQIAGTGPFMAKNYVPEQIIELEAFKEYHRGAPQIERIERPVIKDAQTRLNKYKGGELDLVMLERQDVAALQEDPAFKDDLKFFPRPATWYIGLNQLMVPQFKDVRVRQAFAMAIDRKTIVDDILGGINQEANGILPPGVLGHDPNRKALPYDPAGAQKLLADAGYPGGKGFPVLEMSFREQRPDIRLVAEAAADMLNKNLGIKVNLHTMEWRAYLEKHQANKMPFFHMRWGADYLDPENFLSVLLASYGPEMHVGYNNPEYDALCRAGDTELDPTRRLEYYKQAEDLVINDAPFIPIYFQRDAELIRPYVKGLRESLFGHLPHTTVKLEE